jgi:capping protein beta
MENKTKLQDCVSLLKKLPIAQFDETITALSNLVYEEDELLNEFLQKCDNRIEVNIGEDEFIKSEYNRDGDSYRSPNTNKFYPPSEDAVLPKKELRDFEVKLNTMFNLYINQYYSPTTICSVYVWGLGEEISDGFAVAVLIKNKLGVENNIDNANWDSINILNITFSGEDEKTVSYKLTSSVNLTMHFKHNICGNVNLSGTLCRQV